MYYFLSIIAGLLTATMIAFNGGLTDFYGTYTASVIIHFIGLIFIAGYMIYKKEKFLPKKRLPWTYFLGGAIGVGTTVFNNIAFSAIGASAILALSLLGQSLTAIVIDHFGLFGMPQNRFEKKKLIGLSFVLLGILFILTS